ncbi:MAG: TMEM175 family protein [Pseudomonadota bacterium]
MTGQPELFEMRRMEALSNTIFGVAMTLLAYQIPKDRFAMPEPKFLDIWHSYGSHLSALLLSFIVAGMFWYSHQRRLNYAPEANRIEVLVNLLFLLSIIALPVTSGLMGSYFASADVIALYGFNLTLISTLNTILWVIAAAPRRDWVAMVAPVFATVVFLVGSTLSVTAPRLAMYAWPLAFVAPVLAAYAERWEKRRTGP